MNGEIGLRIVWALALVAGMADFIFLIAKERRVRGPAIPNESS